MGTLPVLPVDDVQRAAKFYVEVLGFTEVFQMPGPDRKVHAAQVSREGCDVMFNLNPGDAGKQGGGIYIWIRIEDSNLDAFFTDLKKGGLSIVEAIADRPWGDRSFAVKDLNGYILAFNQRLRKSA
jgi:uncharacterized glyoxalase superfamily protein PhnB